MAHRPPPSPDSQLSDLKEAYRTVALVRDGLNDECKRLLEANKKLAAEAEALNRENEGWHAKCDLLGRQLQEARATTRGDAHEDPASPPPDERGGDADSGDPGAHSRPPLADPTLWSDPGLQRDLEELLSTAKREGWLIPPDDVEKGTLLGSGTSGETFQAVWRGGQVACKYLAISNAQEATSFLREASVLASLRHPNVLAFYGAVVHPPSGCAVVCQYMEAGNLSDWLYPRRDMSDLRSSRPLLERLRMGLQVARGLQALEEASPPILHRDVKPSNVFVGAGGVACLGDFGLSRRLAPAATLTGETGTYLYMAPEVINHAAEYDTKADVFSFGVMLAELLKGELPYEGLYLTPVQCALAVGQDELRPPLPPTVDADLASIATACFAAEPSLRPTFAYLVASLTAAIARLEAAEAVATPTPAGVFGRLFRPSSLLQRASD